MPPDSEDCSQIMRTAIEGCSVKVTVCGLHQRSIRTSSVGVGEAMESSEFSRRRDFVHRPKIFAYASTNRGAIEVSIDALNGRRLGMRAVELSSKVVQRSQSAFGG